MRVEAFGGLAVVDGDGEPLSAGGGLQGTAFAVLCVTPGEPVSLGVFAEALWGDSPPDRYVRSLATYMSNLRKQLGVGIESSSGAYRLELGRGDVTTTRFADAVAGAGGDVGVLRSALALWVGEPFAGLEGHGVFRDERVRLAELRLVAARGVARDDIDAGRSDDVVRGLVDLVDVFPYDEVLRGLLMEALFRTGRQAEAIRSFAAFRGRLVDELGVEPSPDLRDLELAILNQDLPVIHQSDTTPASSEPGDLGGGVLSEDPAAPVRVEGGTNLPLPTSSFVGRAGEIGELVELCSQRRMVTVAGIGGIGKTRLAIEVARSCRGSFDDGVFLVDLVGVSDPDAVGRRFLSVLGIAERPDQPAVETLAGLLGDARQLLVVDNCEHVIAGVADVLGRLLPACPGVHVLATSRVRVGVDGEELWELAGLDASDATRLLADRAHSVNRDFSLTTEDQEAVARICRALDGIPLAIELAAARLRASSLDEVAARLSDRFGFLVDTRRTAPQRHKTLLSMIDWSYDLLTVSDQRLFRMLGVFRGGFNLEAVVAVCDTDRIVGAETLERLVDVSLVTADTAQTPTRYRLLETVREFAVGLLETHGETDDALDRHLAYYSAFGREAFDKMGTPFSSPPASHDETLVWRAAVAADVDNLRDAIQRGLDVDALDAAVSILAPLADYWQLEDNYVEAIEYLDAVLGREDCPETVAQFAALTILGCALAAVGENDRAEAVLERADDVCSRVNPRYGSARVPTWQSMPLWNRGDVIGAVACVEEAYVRAEAAGEPTLGTYIWNLTYHGLFIGRVERAVELVDRFDLEWPEDLRRSLALRSALARYRGDYQQALVLAEEGLSHAATGRAASIIGNMVADALLNVGRLDEAATVYRQMEVSYSERGLLVEVDETAAALGLVALRRGEPETARKRILKALEGNRRDPSPFVFWISFHAVAEWFDATGDPETAATVLAHCAALTEERSYDPAALDRAPLVTLDELAQRIGPDQFLTLTAAGRAATTDDLATELVDKLTP